MSKLYRIAEVHVADSFSSSPERVVNRLGRLDDDASIRNGWFQGTFVFIDGKEPTEAFFFRVKIKEAIPMEANA